MAQKKDETKHSTTYTLADDTEIKVRNPNVREGRDLMNLAMQVIACDPEEFTKKLDSLMGARKDLGTGETSLENVTSMGIKLMAPALYSLVGDKFETLVAIVAGMTSRKDKDDWKTCTVAEFETDMPFEAIMVVVKHALTTMGFQTFFGSTPGNSPTATIGPVEVTPEAVN